MNGAPRAPMPARLGLGRGRLAAIAAVAATSLAAVGLVATNAFAATLLADDFEDGNSGGWSTSGGSWSVVNDGSRALRQSGTSANARARAGSASWTDYTVSARVKPLAFNGADRFVAVTARVQSSSNYYGLALTGANTVELKKYVGGAATTLATARLTVTTGTWYTLRLGVAGATLTGAVDGNVLVTGTDSQFKTGQVGLAGYYASASFDDIAVATGAGPGPSPSASRTAGPSPSASVRPSLPPPPPPGGLVGFATVNDKGRDGTTGGAGGPVLTATTTAQLLDFIKRPGPHVIQISGTITLARMEWVTSHKTIVGLGADAVITGGGLTVKNEQNVIIRNITFTNSRDDGINIDDGSHHVWVDHNTFTAAFDGAVDVRLGASYVTVSWNHFDRQDKNLLLGAADTNGGTDIGNLRVTYHHNFFDRTHQRNPRVRFGEPVHVYNNYYFNVVDYGIASTMDAGVLVEGNYFENVPQTITVGYQASGPGRVVERGNIYVNSGQPQTNGTVVEPRTFYPYTLDRAADVPSIVRAGAGAGKL